MGVPSFYKWLIEKYPKITHKFFFNPTNADSDVFKGDPTSITAFDNKPPNQVFKCDNLYIDMNGLVHNATHVKAATREEFAAQVKQNLYYSLDRILFASQPQKLLYLALDGVPPRAKASEQRQRRYKTALALRKSKAHAADPTKEVKYVFDSNEISPGTDFMANVHKWLHEFFTTRTAKGENCSGLEIILSDTSVPGEGEHKIMDIIRHLISQKVYDENTHHMFYGLDADLVFLGLSTSTKYFTVLRDSHVYIHCRGCGLPEHPTYECVKRSSRSGNIICVGRIPPHTEPKVLLDLFGSCGEITKHLVDYTPIRPGFMFIEYKDQSAAASALQGGWMLNGKSLTVVYAEFDIFAIDNCVTITRIPPNVTNEDVLQLMLQFGEIKQMWTPPHRAVFIEFKEEESAKQARLHRWGDKSLIVRASTPRQARIGGGKHKRKKGPKIAESAESKDAFLSSGESKDSLLSSGEAKDTLLSPKIEKESEKESEKENEDEDDDEEDEEEEKESEEEVEETKKEDEKKTWRFELTQLHTLCEYFESEFAGKTAQKFIPDFVLFSAFVGNDFVRPLPNFAIINGSLDVLFEISKRMGASFSLVTNGHVNLKNLAAFMEEMVIFERSTITRPRLGPPKRDQKNDNENNNNNNSNENKNSDSNKDNKDNKDSNNPSTPTKRGGKVYRPKQHPTTTSTSTSTTPTTTTTTPTPLDSTTTTTASTTDTKQVQVENSAAKIDNIPAKLENEPEIAGNSKLPEMAGSSKLDTPGKERPPRPSPARGKAPPRVRDPVKQYEEWRVKYYDYKMGIDVTKTEDVQKVCRAYLDSLIWVLRYYFSGVPSWSWFYPFHYAPIACDLLSYIKHLISSGHETTDSIQFPLSAPIKPLYHLMSILPVESVECVPLSYQPLMTSPTSPIADLYPTEFKIDSNGNRFGSGSVVLVEFVDTSRLLKELEPLDSQLSAEETKRNSFGKDQTISSPSPSSSPSSSLPPTSSSLAPPPYRIHETPLSPQDKHWVRRRSGFALPALSLSTPNPSPSTPPPSTHSPSTLPLDPTSSTPATSTPASTS